MSSNDRYQVSNSGAVAEEYRRLADEAWAAGLGPIFLVASRWVLEELARTPTEFGESRETRGALAMRCGFARPLYVEYAVHEAARMVFIRRFALASSPGV